MLYVPFRNQHLIATAIPTSHGYEPPETRERIDNAKYFVDLFTLGPTTDPTPFYCIPEAIRFREEVCGGEDRIREYCFDLARAGGDHVARVLGTRVLSDKSDCVRRCAFANVLLPLVFTTGPDEGDLGSIPLSDAQAVYDWFYETAPREFDTYFQIKYYQKQFWVRFSAQIYLELEDFEWAARTLLDLCTRARNGEWKKKHAQ